mmetsp:Transcript_5319/g.15252  ORF Transcript_5319/g.15252 Transcript_5319/m.15252 type:complete len:167 (-) Transcript_5319:1134-1634(-)
MAAVMQILGASDPLKTAVLAEAALGLLASAWGGEPTTAIALFGLVALESQQSLVQLFVLLNASSIIFDVLRLMLAKDAAAHWLLSFVTIITIVCKAYVSYQCYDLFGLGSGSGNGTGDGSEYQPAAAGPRSDPFRYEAPPPAQNLYSSPAQPQQSALEPPRGETQL